MVKRSSIILIATAGMLALGGWFFDRQTQDPVQYCRSELQPALQERESSISAILADTLLGAFPENGLPALSQSQKMTQHLMDYVQDRTDFFLFQKDSLLLWTDPRQPTTRLPQGQAQAAWIYPAVYQRHDLSSDGHYWLSRLSWSPDLPCLQYVSGIQMMDDRPILVFRESEIHDSLPPPSYLPFVCFALALFLVTVAVYQGAGSLVKSGYPRAAAGLWLTSLWFATQTGYELFRTKWLDHWLTQSIWPNGFLGPTPLDWLWQSWLLFLSMALYWRFVRWKPTSSARFNSAASLLFYLQIGTFILVLAFTLRRLVLTGRMPLQVDNIFYIDPFTVFTCVGIGLWMLALFLFSHRLVRQVRLGMVNLNHRLIALAISLVPLTLLNGWIPTGLSNWIMGAIVLLYLVLFDLFFDRDRHSLTWLMVWLIAFGALNSGLLYAYSLERDRQTMTAYAKKLANPVDQVLLEQLNAEWSAAGNRLNAQTAGQIPYVSRFYTVEKADQIPENTRWKPTGYTHVQYSGHQYLWRSDRDTFMLTLPTTRGPRLPSGQSDTLYYRGLTDLSRYHYTRFTQAQSILQRGPTKSNLVREADAMPLDTYRQRLTGSRLAVLYRQDADTWVLLERPLGGYFKPLSIFAFSFLLFLGLSIALAFAASWLALTHEPVSTLFNSTTSLRTKIQMVVLGIILISFTAIAVLTISSFRRTAEREQENRLLQSVGSIRTALQQELSIPFTQPDTAAWQASVQQLSRRYGLAIRLYGPDGARIASAESVASPWEAGLMNPVAWISLRSGLSEYRIVSETLDGLSYKTLYLPLAPGRPWYLGVPYYAQNRDMQEDLYDFMGSLFSLYAFALLVAAGVTLLVSRSVTEPLARVREGLEDLRLGSNEALDWDRPDEVGELVKAYNDAIQKLAESTEALRRSEREMAWREMAKQVAHEIKNPLTPMKLRVQHLMRAYEQNPQRAAPLIKSVSVSLIEQIDTLTRIADEFSHFAKMPRPQVRELDLRQVLASVCQIFAEDGQEQVLFNTQVDRAPLQADRDQLNRIFNNLIKNALQAIPNDREGRVRVVLSQKEDNWQVAVADNGIGIPEDIQEKVFSPNFTTKSSGTGLGLAMCRQMVEQVGGRIYFVTTPGEGTTFYVLFPKSVPQ